MYKIFFFCPEDHTEKVKEAMFNAGAGRLETTKDAHGRQKA